MNDYTRTPAGITVQRIDGSLYKSGDIIIRWVAYIGDGIISVIIGSIILVLSGDALAAIGIPHDIAFLLILLELFAVIFLYYPLMESLYMATQAKMLLGLRVVDTNGNRIGLLRSILRSLVKLICLMIPLGAIIGGLISLLSDERRTLWDLLSGTKVIQKL